MSNQNSFDLSPSVNRSKKLPPPPLCLPASNTTTTTDAEEQLVKSDEQNKSTINCSLSSSSKECSHKEIPYILPTVQRDQILERLINSSSTLLLQPSSETKQKRSQLSLNTTQINFLKQRHASRQGIITDAEWLDFIRFIVHKPFENELRMLLDKYKMTYFDRVNSPTTSDAMVRVILCDMVSEALTSYSTSSSIANDTLANVPLSIVTNHTSNNGSTKRKRYDTTVDNSNSSSLIINNQTKFVISYIIPGKCDNSNNKSTNQQRYKQFQKKYSHLFKYIPDKEEQTFLIRNGYLKNLNLSSTRSSHNQTNNICLMLYEEILSYMDEDDIQLSGISIDNSFVLSEPIFTHIYSSI